MVGGRPIGDASNVLLHQRNCRGVPEVRNEKITLHLHDLILTKRTRLMSTPWFNNLTKLLPNGEPRENLSHDIV